MRVFAPSNSDCLGGPLWQPPLRAGTTVRSFQEVVKNSHMGSGIGRSVPSWEGQGSRFGLKSASQCVTCYEEDSGIVQKNRANLLKFLPGRIIRRMPFNFKIASLLGQSYFLRCVLFHDVSDQASPFTDGLGVTIGREEFEARIRFLSKHYVPVRLGDLLDGRERETLPTRPVLVTFDDAYASVYEQAVPICRKYSVPADFFVDGSLVGNRVLALQNLVCYVTNTIGFAPNNVMPRVAVWAIRNMQDPERHSYYRQ